MEKITYSNCFIHLMFSFCLLLFICGLFCGCKKDWLDIKPSNSIAVPSTLQDFQAILDNPQLYQYSPGLSEIATDGHYLQEASFLSRTDEERNAYTWSQDVPYARITEWVTSYSNIYDINLVLNGLNGYSAKTHSEISAVNDLKGQAKFHRAKIFYELAQVFAPPFVQTTASTELGIVLHLQPDLNIKSVRSTLQDTYMQIIDDLSQAKNELLLQQQYKTRPSRVAAYAMLSRVYLGMENYDLARKYADSALIQNNTLIDFNSLNTSLAYPFHRLNAEVIFHSTMINYSSVGSQLRIEQSFRNTYAVNDLRGFAFFGVNNGLVTFKGSYNGSRQNFSGLATNELYLNRAECFARAGQLAEAMKDLNDLIKTRWKVVNGKSIYVNQIAIDKVDALKRILEERKKELLIRGVRWSDLRRLNRDPDFAMSLSRTVGGNTYTLEPNSFKYVFPIPNDIIEVSEIEQNKQW